MPEWKLGDPVLTPQRAENFLEGIPAIATYMGKSYNTIIRWIEQGYLPAAKNPSGRWFTTKSLIDSWIVAGHQAEINERARRLFHGVGPNETKYNQRPTVEQKTEDPPN